MTQWITDRSGSDIIHCKQLRERVINEDAVALSEWIALASKGTYDAADYERIRTGLTQIIKDIEYYFGIAIPVLPNWPVIVPHNEGMQYLSAVISVKQALDQYLQFPPLPGDINKLDYNGANNIERVLEAAEALFDEAKSVVPLCGAYYSGAVIYPMHS